ncbi:metal ABC transporter permease [Anaerosphaera multitolerans]|uniref:Metal ABC transporter permease n=1 Tax=Anaerosphaera multitolerans TaxID=2487351 RepID=A0A437S5E5_9FIRM|nr:metal ABC transporter permease [Anaerosphaera multitolerans]RVU54262.1 metal ABC transporter permease [Anaerosphaera multitolerans]
MNGIDLIPIEYEPLLILIITSIACGLIGSFLVLRKLSMLADGISHSVLLGIVLAFFITGDGSSPYLLLGASVFGVVTVLSVEGLSSTKLVKGDDAVGIVYPLFFSIAVILITKYARNIPFGTDTVLMGEVILAPLNRINFMGFSISKSLFQMITMLCVNIGFIVIFFKELKITSFDEEFANIAGFSASFIFYALMILTSMTTVTAFNSVGAILVISFLIAPGSSAYLISRSLKEMLLLSCIYAVANSILGFFLAMKLNVSMSGMTAVVAGITFFLTFLFNREGFLTSVLIRKKNKSLLKTELFIMYLGNHMNDKNLKEELGKGTIKNHLMWTQDEINRQEKLLIKKEFLGIRGDKVYYLTEKGIQKYNEIKKNYGV